MLHVSFVVFVLLRVRKAQLVLQAVMEYKVLLVCLALLDLLGYQERTETRSVSKKTVFGYFI